MWRWCVRLENNMISIDLSQRERNREREMRIEKEIRGWKKEEER